MNKERFITEVTNRLTKLFRASKEGYKVSEAERHRLEGFIHAGIFMQVVTSNEMSLLLGNLHYSILGNTIQGRKSEKTASWSDFDINYDNFDSPTFLR